MSVTAVIGAQWGDEGKGKIVDLLAERAKVVIRFSGGDNAGHTVINQYGEFGMHLIPSGIFYPGVTCIIGNGVAINPEVLIGEIDSLEQRNVDTGRLYISDRAHLIMPYHTLLGRKKSIRIIIRRIITGGGDKQLPGLPRGINRLLEGFALAPAAPAI
ncbi:MAG: adenylosuccinate synthetase, partial [Dehalococcoidales bacterium]